MFRDIAEDGNEKLVTAAGSKADELDERVSQKHPHTKAILTSIFSEFTHEYIQDAPWYDLFSFVAVVDERAELDVNPGLKKFAFALITDAADVLTTPRKSNPTRQEAAQIADDAAWLAYDGDGLMSFRWCCELLSVNPETIRKAVEEAQSAHTRLGTNRKLAGSSLTQRRTLKIRRTSVPTVKTQTPFD